MIEEHEFKGFSDPKSDDKHSESKNIRIQIYGIHL